MHYLKPAVAAAFFGALAVAHAADSPNGKVSAMAVAATHIDAAISYEKNGKLAEAEHEYDLAILSYPESDTTYASRGQVRFQRKHYAGAIQDFDIVLSRNPDSHQILLLRGISKSLLAPEDVKGACADFLTLKNQGISLDGVGIKGVNKYCDGQNGWNGT